LTIADFPKVTQIDDSSFAGCTSLTSINMPLATSIAYHAFGGCTSLTYATTENFPSVKGELGGYAFRDCTNLTIVDFPLVTSIGGNAFEFCTSLSSINFPLVTSIGVNAFNGCSSLAKLDFSVLTTINTKAFYNCSALNSLIIRNSTMCTLKNIDAFTGTPIESGTGYIYVPADLIDTYVANSVWLTYASQFRALEDYTVDGTTTGALDETKI
jgi:hypothetical protein